MHIKLQNRYIVTLIPFLEGMKLKSEKSRARSKFLALAAEAYASLHDSELDLLREYAVQDERGEPRQDESGKFTLRDNTAREYMVERDKLFSEVAEIEGGTYTAHLSLMRQALAEYDGELEGDNAALYDALCDAFDEAAIDEAVKSDG